MIFAVLIGVAACILFSLIVPSPTSPSAPATGGALLIGNKIVDGDIPTPGPATVIYTVPSNVQSATIMVVSLVNTTAGAITVNLYVDANGTDRRIIDKDLSLAAAGSTGSRFAEQLGISIPQGRNLKADASGVGVDYVIQILEVPATA